LPKQKHKYLDYKLVADIVGQDIQWSRNTRIEYSEDWKRYYKIYKNFIDKALYPFEANLAIPTAYSNIEVQTSFLVDMIFEAGDFVEVLGKTQAGQLNAHAVKEMLNYHFRHSLNTYEDMESFIRQLLMYGTSIYKVFYDVKPQWRTREFPEYEFGEVKRVKEELVLELSDHKPAGYTVDLWHFGVDPNADSIKKARYVFEEMWLSPYDLQTRAEFGPYDKKNVKKILGRQDWDVNEGLTERLEEIDISPQQKSPYIERGKIHCVDYWGYITHGWEGGKLKPGAVSQLAHVVMAVGSSGSVSVSAEPVVLLAEPTPYTHNDLPYIDARINACVGEFYGTGDIEMCESLYVEQRDNRNAAMDNLNRSIHHMWKVQRDAVIDESEMMTKPGGVIHVDEMDNLEPIKMPSVDPAHFKTQDDIRRDIEMATGVNDFVMGQYRSSTGFNDTATGISLIQQTALKRLGQKGQVVQRSVKNIASQVFKLVAQYQPQGVSVRILDRESAVRWRFVDISPDALQQEYDFYIVNAPSLGSKPMRVQQLNELLAIVVQTASMGGMPPEVARLYKRIVEEMGVPNPQELAGFPGFNQPLPQVPDTGEAQELLTADEENRIIVDEGRMVPAKMFEPHPQHIFVHQEVYDNLQENEARARLAEHIKQHHVLMEQEKSILAETMGAQLQLQGQGQQAPAGGPQKGGKSPTGAGGQETQIRNMGNMMAGNA